KEPADLEVLTPPRPTKQASEQQQGEEPTPRGSLVYPPAPPPSANKQSPRRRSGSCSEDEDEDEDGDDDENNNNGGLAQDAPAPETPDVGAIIRDSSHARAFRELTKADLVVYAKQHHITLTTSRSKKELFEVARRLAKGNLEDNK
ncbi:hypothetical protein DQ04_11181020, partial [Trypanosoma grayi]|uniref:hypothetical protein n=1 Tax=Trypanosoma grayi TaxID=71804 RepID=UPI0004F41437